MVDNFGEHEASWRRWRRSWQQPTTIIIASLRSRSRDYISTGEGELNLVDLDGGRRSTIQKPPQAYAIFETGWVICISSIFQKWMVEMIVGKLISGLLAGSAKRFYHRSHRWEIGF